MSSKFVPSIKKRKWPCLFGRTPTNKYMIIHEQDSLLYKVWGQQKATCFPSRVGCRSHLVPYLVQNGPLFRRQALHRNHTTSSIRYLCDMLPCADGKCSKHHPVRVEKKTFSPNRMAMKNSRPNATFHSSKGGEHFLTVWHWEIGVQHV